MVNATSGTTYVAQFASSIINMWNTDVVPILGNYLNQTDNTISADGSIVPTDIAVRAVSTLGEVAKQVSNFAIPLAKLLVSNHPYYVGIAIALVVILPVIREYCASGWSNRMCIPVIAFKIITRPVVLAWRVVKVITGGDKVTRLRNDQTITQLKQLHPTIQGEIQLKQQAVANAINLVANADDQAACRVAANHLFNAANVAPVPPPGGGVVANNFFEQHAADWNFLQSLLSDQNPHWAGDPRLQAVKPLVDEWKKYLDLYILTQ